VVSAAGVDGCRTGWVVAVPQGAVLAPTFAAVLAAVPPETVIAVDIPVGLAPTYVPGGRECDRLARKLLGRPRGSSVFPAPPRSALGSRDLATARDRGWPATLQGLNLLPKIEEVDATMSPALQARVHEAHPELAFQEMNGGAPLLRGKRDPAGRAERRALLEQAGITVPPRPFAGEAADDLLDACAALWIAQRITRQEAIRVPERPLHDARGLRMEIWR
jgi:predicted RNase H-like nuclease